MGVTYVSSWAPRRPWHGESWSWPVAAVVAVVADVEDPHGAPWRRPCAGAAGGRVATPC